MRLVEGVAVVDDTDAFVARLEDTGDEHGCAIQAFDARLVVDREHLAAAVERADRAFARGENVARDRAVEILLYAAGRRQINRALALGVDEGRVPVVVVVAAEPGGGGEESGREREEERAVEAVRELLEPGSTLDETDEEAVREFFDVSDAELAATGAGLPALVRERVALLDVEK